MKCTSSKLQLLRAAYRCRAVKYIRVLHVSQAAIQVAKAFKSQLDVIFTYSWPYKYRTQGSLTIRNIRYIAEVHNESKHLSKICQVRAAVAEMDKRLLSSVLNG